MQLRHIRESNPVFSGEIPDMGVFSGLGLPCLGAPAYTPGSQRRQSASTLFWEVPNLKKQMPNQGTETLSEVHWPPRLGGSSKISLGKNSFPCAFLLGFGGDFSRSLFSRPI
jgi:hypothetical protein